MSTPFDDDPDAAPIEARHYAVMNDIAKVLSKAIGNEYGFMLMVFDFNTKGRINYISNAERSDMLDAMREFIVHSERDAGGGHA